MVNASMAAGWGERMHLRRLGPWLALVCFAPAARADAPVDWPTGRELERQLAAKVTVTWGGVPLRQALTNLCRQNRLGLVLDRRVDPGQEVEIELAEMPLRDALTQIAARRRLGAAILEGVVYIGPVDTASKLRTLAHLRAQEAAELPAARRSAFRRTRAWRWEDLATPRELLNELAEEAELNFTGLDVPHDLWGGADLPPLLWTARLSLIAAQFGSTFRLAADGRRVEFAPIPEEVAIERSFPGGNQPEELADTWRELLPECRIEVAGSKIVVRGTLEDLEQIESSRSGGSQRTRVTGDAVTRFTLTYRDRPLRPLLDKLAEQANLEFRYDEQALAAAGVSLDTRTSFEAKEVTLDELLRAALDPAGLDFRRDASVVELFPKAP
jgi:hypothetical protein